MSDLILPKESYRLMGMLFDVHNKLGPIYKEKHYTDAVEAKFKQEKIKYIREKSLRMHFKDLLVPDFAPDFIVWDCIVLDIKAYRYIKHDDLRQMSRYLNETKLPLGVIANFKRQMLEYKRIINPKRDKNKWDVSFANPLRISDGLAK